MQIETLDLWTATKGAKIEVPDIVAKANIHKDVIKRLITWQLSKRRAGTHSTKGRSQVCASKRKIYKQKGTGGARHHARSANLFRGGGVTFGPVFRSHESGMPKRVRFLGICSSLRDKAEHGNLFQISENVNVPKVPKTRDMVKSLQKVNLTKVLVLASPEHIDDYKKSLSNIPYCDVLPFFAINVYDIVRHHSVLLDNQVWQLLQTRKGNLNNRHSVEKTRAKQALKLENMEKAKIKNKSDADSKSNSNSDTDTVTKSRDVT